MRKQSVGQNTLANNYQTIKADRQPALLNKIKPVIGGKYPNAYQQNCFLYKNDTAIVTKQMATEKDSKDIGIKLNPVFENYISEYMETTQHDINENISFNQFVTIPWPKGLPGYIIEFIVQLVGNKREVLNYFQRISKGLH